MNFYNDIDENVCAWLRELIADNLIPPGHVSSQSITDINPDELAQYTQCHFFCGIAGWLEAFLIAGIKPTERRWTGSCPCQPFSAAGAQEGQADARHLWPAFMRLIRVCRPDSVFGEQVEGAIGFGWLDGIQADLEAEGYAVGHCVLGAHSAGSPNIRQRLYWVAYGPSDGRGQERSVAERSAERGDAEGQPTGFGLRGAVGGMAVSESERGCRGLTMGDGQLQEFGRSGEDRRLGHTGHTGPQGHGSLGRKPDEEGRQDSQRHDGEAGFWSSYDLIPCRDGKARRIESGVKPLVDGLPKGVVRVCDPGLPIDAQASAEGRVIRLKGYGNAINPHTAALFIRAALDGRTAVLGRVTTHHEPLNLDE